MAEPSPEYFRRMCVEFLGASGSLSQELWGAYCRHYPEKAHCLRYAIDKLTYEYAPASLEILQQRLHHAAGMLSPQAFLEISGKVSAPGRPRRKDLVQFEEAVLR